MIMAAALQLVFALLVCPIQAADNPINLAGYGKTVWGMSESEVLKAESARAEKLDKPIEGKTLVATITIREIEIDTIKFRVLFSFGHKTRKLAAVNLISVSKSFATFPIIEKLLTEKYGPPTYKEEAQDARPTTLTTSWKLPRTTIELYYSTLSGLHVIYRPTESSADRSKNL